MIKQILPIAVLGAAIFSLSACNSNTSFKTLKNGVEYRIVKDVSGPKPKVGDYVEMYITQHVGDTQLFNSRKMMNGQPSAFVLQASLGPGDPVEGFKLLSVGDSAVFRYAIPVDSLRKTGAQLPPWLKQGMKLEFDVVLVSIKSAAEGKAAQEKKQAEAMAEAEKQSKAQMAIDDKILADYFAQNHISPSKTPSGVYYTISAPGSGANPKPGQAVTVNYTGKTIAGKTFDSNQDTSFHHKEPFTFTIGQHQVIQGWDEGVSMLKKGSKATLYIPSPLAYGPQARSAEITANCILIFNIEVTDIKDAPPAAPRPQQ